jgi:BASS family bile acid:Na+ symporter
MDILLNVGLPLSLAFIMFSLGLGLTFVDFGRVLNAPKAFCIGLVAQVAAVPLTAFILLHVFTLSPALAFGVMILAFCPGGVTSNILTKLAGGDLALSITLTAVISLLSVLTVPPLVAWSARYFMGEAAPAIDVTSLAIAMFVITAVPVLIGLLLHHFKPDLAQKIEPAMAKAAALLFVLIVVAALAANWSVFIGNLSILGPVLIALNLLLLALGLGISKAAGLPGTQSSAVAIEAGVQNSTLGITVAGLIAADGGLGPFALPSGVYGITMYLVTLPVIFLILRRR